MIHRSDIDPETDVDFARRRPSVHCPILHGGLVEHDQYVIVRNLASDKSADDGLIKLPLGCPSAGSEGLKSLPDKFHVLRCHRPSLGTSGRSSRPCSASAYSTILIGFPELRIPHCGRRMVRPLTWTRRPPWHHRP